MRSRFAIAVLAAAALLVGIVWARPAASPEAPLPAPLRDIPGLEHVQTRRVGPVAIIEGTVARETDRELAETIAASRPGVSAVVNRVTVSVSLGDRLRTWREASIGRLTRVLSAAPLLALAALVVWLSWWLGRLLARRYRQRRPEGKPRNPFLVSLAAQGIQVGFGLIGLLTALQLMDAVALAGAVVGSAGVVGIALGFAFRDLAENYVASILLSLRQPFAPNDHVVIDGNEGVVVGLNSRATLLMTPDGNHLRLPNALVFKAVILNYTRNGLRRFDFLVSLAPDASPGIALTKGLSALSSIDGVLREPAAFAQLQSADCDWLQVQYFAWCDQRHANFGWLRSEGIRRVRECLESQGVAFQRPTLPVGRARPLEPTLPTSAAGPPSDRRADVGRQVAAAVTEAREEMAGRDLLSSSAPKE
jgi:small conductance mechanosensitive channel